MNFCKTLVLDQFRNGQQNKKKKTHSLFRCIKKGLHLFASNSRKHFLICFYTLDVVTAPYKKVPLYTF